MAFVCLAAALLTLVLPLLPHAGTLILGSLIPLITFSYLAIRRAGQGRDWFELVVCYGLLYLLYFSLGAIFLRLHPERLSSISLASYLDLALALAVAGFAALVGGYASLTARVRRPKWTGYEPSGFLGYVLPGVLGVVGLLAGSLQTRTLLQGGAISTLSSALGQLAPLFMFAWFLVWYGIFAGRLRSVWAFVILAGYIGAALGVLGLTVGQKAMPITLAGIPLIAYWYARRVLPWKTILLLLLVSVFVVFPLYGTFRGQSGRAPTIEKLERSFSTIQSGNVDDYKNLSVMSFLGRFAVVESIAAVIRDVGQRVEFIYGRTLFLAPISLLVPRFIWPEKPDIVIGHEFGRTFRLISRSDRVTHIAATYIAELYWNFHVPGVLVGMFLIGLTFRWLYEKYGSGFEIEPLRKSMYVMLLVMILQGESSIAAVSAGIVKTFVISLAFIAFFRRLGLFVDPKQREGHRAPHAAPGE